jgi:ComF family protein
MTVNSKQRPKAYSVYKALWSGFDWLFPPYCAGCGEMGERWCGDCDQKTTRIEGIICDTCGRKIRAGVHCFRCIKVTPYYKAMRSWAQYKDPIKQAIHQLKFKGDITLAEVLARSLITLFEELDWPVDIITAVPISKKRQLERGYNQAALLARPLAIACQLPFEPNALRKIRHTPTQVGMAFSERQNNLQGAFKANHEILSGKKICIIDDVTASGATMNACAQAALEAGTDTVFGLTLTRS